jgi:hypothetical protein
MVPSIFYEHISLQIWVYFAFRVSENNTKYIDVVRMISSIPSLREGNVAVGVNVGEGAGLL